MPAAPSACTPAVSYTNHELFPKTRTRTQFPGLGHTVVPRVDRAKLSANRRLEIRNPYQGYSNIRHLIGGCTKCSLLICPARLLVEYLLRRVVSRSLLLIIIQHAVSV